MCSHFNLYVISLIYLSMKKNFFAKLGHFFLVSAVLFNGFGVGFVNAEADPAAVSFAAPTSSVVEGNGTGEKITSAAIAYTGPTLVGDESVVVTVSVDIASSTAFLNQDFKFSNLPITFTSSSAVRYDFLITIISDDVIDGDKTVVLRNSNSDSTFTLTIQDD